MISLHRTVDDPPLAVLRCGKTILFPWADLLALRDLVAVVPASTTHDEDYPRRESEPWGVSGSSFGIALMREGCETLYFETDHWEQLRVLLYVGDELLSQVDVAEISGRPQQRVAEAIANGFLFAFRVPELERRQWKIPRAVAEAWAE